MVKVKVCGIKDPVNAAEIAGTLPDFMGFIFYPGSKRYVGNSPPESLFRTIPGSILKTGVFVDQDPVTVIETMKAYRLDIVQLHGNESPEYCAAMKEKGLAVIKAFRISSRFNFNILKKFLSVSDHFLFDTETAAPGGSGLKFDWNLLREYTCDKPFFLGGGIRPGDASLIKKIENDRLFAVDINSGFESSPGIKDYRKVKNFINEIKA